jgi:hypothetical protein
MTFGNLVLFSADRSNFADNLVPAQPVDATLSNQLIHKHFPEESICLADVAKT